MRWIGKLPELKKGQKAVIVAVDSSGGMQRRLQDLGFIRGTEIMCLHRSPLGDPIAFYIRGAVIALRSEDAACIRVQGASGLSI